ncbi:MAG: hypothetical protein FWD65_07840 [Coriobacteriia bacterium]|nr:hypothetical protein [Coriobacteriia bacterium]
MSDVTSDPKLQSQSGEMLRKVLRVFMIIWVVLFLVYLVPVLISNFAPIAYSTLSINLFVPLLYVNILYWVLVFPGAVTILWAVKALRASVRVVVICAGAMMIATTLGYIFYQNWVRVMQAATFGGLFPLWAQTYVAFPHVLLMTLCILLFAGGLLLDKEKRSGGRWIAGALALLAWVLMIGAPVFSSANPYHAVFLALVATALSAPCIAISLKRPRPAVAPPAL